MLATSLIYLSIIKRVDLTRQKRDDRKYFPESQGFLCRIIVISYASLVYVSWTTLLLKPRCMLQKRATRLGAMIERPFTKTTSNQNHDLKSLKM